ncbi:MAG: hypothetical protein JO353_00095, partial [Phycisphaerae bacterium]|nr:hypothetical protein [Phycisphaerae bacterium]
KAYEFDFKPNGNLDPILHAFAGEENSGLNTAQVFSYWQIDLSANKTVRRVWDYQPDGDRADPAITAHDLGGGRVIFFSTSANADWTTLPAKPAYVTLMHELIAGAIRTSDSWMNLSAGEALKLPATLQLAAPPTLKDPSQRDVPMRPPTGDRATYRSTILTQPGVYHLSTGARTIPIAVNVPIGSADVRPVSADEIRKALGNINIDMLGDALPPADAVATAGTGYGWSIMMVVLVFLGIECLAAFRFGRYRR